MFWGEIKSESLETQVKCTSLGKTTLFYKMIFSARFRKHIQKRRDDFNSTLYTGSWENNAIKRKIRWNKGLFSSNTVSTRRDIPNPPARQPYIITVLLFEHQQQ